MFVYCGTSACRIFSVNNFRFHKLLRIYVNQMFALITRALFFPKLKSCIGGGVYARIFRFSKIVLIAQLIIEAKHFDSNRKQCMCTDDEIRLYDEKLNAPANRTSGLNLKITRERH